ncbi:MAG TPA: peptidylprolyl isomerase, partial [Candidatus Deferrimicrobium sp.]|nr:peptidylprolyl isomerase [Candidatus Deferrimicrobium sp.]
MTFRAKPVVKRARRPAWETQDRRNLYLNIGFGLIVIVAVIILAVAAGLTYYNDHLASVGSVDGQSISKDEFNDRLQVDSWRLDEEIRRISNEVSAGHISQTQGASQQQTLSQSRQQLPATSLERLIDSKLQARLAADQGVTVTQQDIDARLTAEATTPEQRHAWIIEVAPTSDTGAIGPSDAQKADAKAKAEQALKDIQGGKAWEDVAKTVSTDASTAPQAGDLGWIQADDTQADEAFLKALFAAPLSTPTDVVEGADGIFRIGRSTEIAQSAVDSAYQAKIVNDGVPIDHYRTVVAADVLHQKLQDKIVADLVAPGPQRKVSEIYIKEAVPPPTADSIKVRHILYSPNGDPANASKVA